MKGYLGEFQQRLDIYNLENKTDYSIEDIFEEFINKGQDYNSEELECMCGHDISKNFIIQHPKNNHKMIIGSSCMKKFLKNHTFRCSGCNSEYKHNKYNHKYKDNLCSDCRIIEKICDKCHEIIKYKFKDRNKEDKIVCNYCKTHKDCDDCGNYFIKISKMYCRRCKKKNIIKCPQCNDNLYDKLYEIKCLQCRFNDEYYKKKESNQQKIKKECLLCDKVIKPEYTYCYVCYKDNGISFKKRLFSPSK
jgi:hypothetical protein